MRYDVPPCCRGELGRVLIDKFETRIPGTFPRVLTLALPPPPPSGNIVIS